MLNKTSDVARPRASSGACMGGHHESAVQSFDDSCVSPQSCVLAQSSSIFLCVCVCVDVLQIAERPGVCAYSLCLHVFEHCAICTSVVCFPCVSVSCATAEMRT